MDKRACREVMTEMRYVPVCARPSEQRGRSALWEGKASGKDRYILKLLVAMRLGETPVHIPNTKVKP